MSFRVVITDLATKDGTSHAFNTRREAEQFYETTCAQPHEREMKVELRHIDIGLIRWRWINYDGVPNA